MWIHVTLVFFRCRKEGKSRRQLTEKLKIPKVLTGALKKATINRDRFPL
jgi:hypothetical protein